MDNLNQLKSEDQMEISTLMMMQMDKLQFDVYGSACDSSSNFLDGSPVASTSSFPPTTPSSTVPFTIDHNPLPRLQEQNSQPQYSNSSARKRGKSPGEVSGTDHSALSVEKQNRMAAMKEMMFRIAAMQTIHIDPESVKPPKRRNVKTSKDPQSVAARHRRERISERIRILQRLVPGGTRMDTASMLDEAVHYVKFLKTQVQSLERYAAHRPATGIGFPLAMASGERIGSIPYLPPEQAYQASQNAQCQDYADAELV